jgi:ABC-type molybdate transport system substrate-binding protein
VAVDRSAFHRMLVTLLPALAVVGAGFALGPAGENLGFFLFGLGLLTYGFNSLANRVLWAGAFTAWFGWLSPLYRAESRAQVVVVVGGSIALVFGVGIMVAAARG